MMSNQSMDKSRRTAGEARKGARHDGVLWKICAEDLVPGTVLRFVNEDGTSPPFSDCTVVETWVVDEHDRRVAPSVDPGLDSRRWEVMVRLARPYVYTSGSACAVPLTAVEVFEVRAASLTRAEDPQYRVVVMSTGQAASYRR